MTFRLSKKEARRLGIVLPGTKKEISPDRMNKLERDYAGYLEQLKLAKEIQDYRFEPLKLILVHGIPGKRNEMSFKADFLVIKQNWPYQWFNFELHEVKGFLREDAQLKLKMAAELFPWFRFYLIQREKAEWKYTEY